MEMDVINIITNCSLDPVDLMDSGLFATSTGFILFTIYFFLICICSIVENTIILMAIIRIKRLHKRRNILIFNLAVTDLMAGVIYPSSVIFNQTYMESIGFIIGFVSVFTILAIAIERFVKIVVFTNHSSHIGTKRQLLGASIIAWVIPSITLFPISVYNYTLHLVIFLTLGPLCIFVVMTAISVLYLAIYVKIRSHDKRMSSNLNLPEKYKFTKLVLQAYVVIVVVYAICWLPWGIESLRIMYTMYFGFDEENRCIVSTLAFYIGVAMVLLNSAVNPIIYFLRLPDFRKGITELIGCCFKKAPVVENCSPLNTTGRHITNSIDDIELT
ncbi:sphingosine 1-phosphate receptor 1-like [Anneissia japonica]|uniref:sphingosine 1-phosphate receptor 1-like n=1 Tax=Anneissia japonica TaxID=1529436 RepID=UPI00142580F2|nr:sphingosine 1-phosphate receptor 1-like [Anneissia japonica]